MKKNHIIALALTADLIILDQITKWLAAMHLQKPIEITSWFSLQYSENTGIAWSLPVPIDILIPLSILLILVIAYAAHINLDFTHFISGLIVAFVMSGAISNLIDRIFRGFVVDFIAVGWWPVFNLADTFLTVGVFLLALNYGKIKRS